MSIKFEDFAIRGIDVSVHNGAIDWTKVKAHFAAIRVGYGRVIDSKFAENWQNSKGRVNRLAYWYMDYYSNHNEGSAVFGMEDADWGREQAETCWSKLKDDPEAIVFLDIENAGASYSPAVTKVPSRAQTIARAFLERMDALNGKVNGIYTSIGMCSWFYTLLRERPLWVAWYNESKTAESVQAAVKNAGWTGRCLIWQYASDGDLSDDGIADGQSMGMESKFLDLNGWLGTAKEYEGMFGRLIDSPDDGAATIPVVEVVPYTILATAIPWLSLRSQPGTSSKLLARYLPGTSVNIAGIVTGDGSQKKGWGKLYGQDAYLSMDFLIKG